MGKVKKAPNMKNPEFFLYQFPMGKVKEQTLGWVQQIALYQFPMGKVKLAGTKGVDISYANGYQFPMGKVNFLKGGVPLAMEYRINSLWER